MTAKQRPTVKRLEYLAGMLAKYRHRWGEFPSERMQAWAAEFDDAKESSYPGIIAWKRWCDQHGYDYSVNAGDILA